MQQVVKDIKSGSFSNDFKGTSLEFVLSVITEQKQVFQSAAHPFYWKPKLRIPDIYEHEDNKRAFGQFLESCLAATEQQLGSGGAGLCPQPRAASGRPAHRARPAAGNQVVSALAPSSSGSCSPVIKMAYLLVGR